MSRMASVSMVGEWSELHSRMWAFGMGNTPIPPV